MGHRILARREVAVDAPYLRLTGRVEHTDYVDRALLRTTIPKNAVSNQSHNRMLGFVDAKLIGETPRRPVFLLPKSHHFVA